jgi:protein-disulfide isomerase
MRKLSNAYSLALCFSLSLALAACGGGGTNTSGGAMPNATAPLAAVAAPAGSDWASVTSETEEGGMKQGNPNAPLQLVEYGSLSCPHCAHFSQESKASLDALIAQGKISYEYRSFKIHPQDEALTAIAMCNGPAVFFPVLGQIYAHYDDMQGENGKMTAWFKTLGAAEKEQLSKLPEDAISSLLVEKMGAYAVLQAVGISSDKAKSCTTNATIKTKMKHLMDVANAKFQVSSTPTFIINGHKLDGVASWDGLQPELKRLGA